MTQLVSPQPHLGVGTDSAGAIEVTEATISLVRNQLLHPTRPELQVLASDQSRRSIDVSIPVSYLQSSYAMVVYCK